MALFHFLLAGFNAGMAVGWFPSPSAGWAVAAAVICFGCGIRQSIADFTKE